MEPAALIAMLTQHGLHPQIAGQLVGHPEVFRALQGHPMFRPGGMGGFGGMMGGGVPLANVMRPGGFGASIGATPQTGVGGFGAAIGAGPQRPNMGFNPVIGRPA